jgi:class 3 adenylate cyclase
VIVKLLDFGISKMTGEGFGNIADAGLTRTGAVLGTPLYMPPEQATGNTPLIGPASDLWALGLIAYRLLTGEIYWRSHTMAELLVEVLSKPMDPPSQRSPRATAEFDAWFFQACDRDPDKRFPSVWDLVKALARALGIGPPALETNLPRMVFPSHAPPVELEEVPETVSAAVDQAAHVPESAPPATMPSHAVPRSERERTHTRPSSRQRHNIKLQDGESKVPSAVPIPPPHSSEPSDATGGTVLRAVEDSLLPDAERRQLTIVVWDVLLASESAGNVDQDKLERVTNEYRETFTRVITHHHGHTAVPLGEGQMAYFGYPLAHEHDARRAVAAALELVETAEKLNARQTNLRLDVRVGLHTGLVLTYEISEQSGTRPAAVAGATPMIAWRLSSLARRNSVLISSATQRLVRNFYQCQSHGFRRLKGQGQQIETFQVSDESGALSRVQGMPTGRLTPMVGRELELGLLLDRWARVEEGSGQLCFVVGEAGMGKSRLGRVFRDRLDSVAHKWIETRCLPDHRDKRMRPVATLFQQLFVLTDKDSAAEKVSKLERAMTHFNQPLEETMPLFGELMGLPVWDRYSPIELTATEQHEKLSDILGTALEALGKRQPVVLMMADLHNADPATIEFLGMFAHDVETLNTMLLCTARSSFAAPWAPRAHISTVTLGKLTGKRVKMMIDELTKGVDLPKEVYEQIVDKTDGVPLFIEEMTKALLDSKELSEKNGKYVLNGAVPDLPVPSTLRDAFMARIDRLGSAKRIVQLAAILGREFAYDLIEAVSPVDTDVLQRGLERLVEAEILQQRGRIPRATYSFKYVLMHATAYESLMQGTRQAFHRKIAQVMLERSMSASRDAQKGASAEVDNVPSFDDKDVRQAKPEAEQPGFGAQGAEGDSLLQKPQQNIRDALRSMTQSKTVDLDAVRKDWKKRNS